MCVYYELMADIVTKFTFGIQELYTEYKFTTSKQIKMKFHLFRCCTFNSNCTCGPTAVCGACNLYIVLIF